MDTEIKQKYPFLKKYGWIVGAGVLVAVAVVWAVSVGGTKSYKTDSSALVIEEVCQGSFDDYVRLNGKVETGVIVQVSALETGIVETKWVEEGAMVNKGDIILTLHNPALRQQILDSESQLAEKQNMLRDTEIAMEKERLQLKQDLLAARTDLTRKSRIAEQQSTLYAENLVSRDEYLKAKEDFDLASQTFELLKDRQHQDSLYRSVQVAMMKESLHNMQENFALVRQRADNLNIRASHAGQLGSLSVELGQNVGSGQQVGQINILDNYKVAVSIDEHYIDRVAPGLSARSSRSDKPLDLTLAKVYPEVSQGQFRADFKIDGELPSNIRVGQTYSIDLVLGEPTDAVMVPKGTFFQSSGGRWVYVVDADGKTAHRRPVRIGRQNYLYYEVLEGLEPGEKVITSSYSNFKDADVLNL